MIKINGDTGVYLQYGFVRLKNLIKKLETTGDSKENLEEIDLNLLSEEEKEIVKKLSIFPLVVNNVLKDYKPNLLVNYLFDLVKDFNSWYSISPKVLQLPEKQRKTKYLFLKNLEKVIKKIFELLNLPEIDRM